MADQYSGLCIRSRREPRESAPAQRPVIWPSHLWAHDSERCESGDLFLIWITDCMFASVAAGIGKLECLAVQTLVAKDRIGHLFADCAAGDCGTTDCSCVKQWSPVDCSIHHQSIVEDDFKVRQLEMAIICAVHRQTRQLSRQLCLAGPALPVGQPSHSQQLDSHPAPEAPLRCPSPSLGMTSPVVLLEACSVLAADSACVLSNVALDDSAVACCPMAAE